jgi:AhpD family alkylhydroperoxidase
MPPPSSADNPTMARRIALAATVPELNRGLAAFSRAVHEASIEPRLRELIQVRASQLNGCARCIQLHAVDAVRAGESHWRLHQVATWREAVCFDERERAALALTETLTLLPMHREVPDEVYDAAAAHFEATELASIVYLIAAINVRNRLNLFARRPPDPVPEGL